MADQLFTGGCQCGAVRYRIVGPLGEAVFCQCRMCQKAFGNFGAALVSVSSAQLQFSRGTPAIFRSSSIVSRAFCRDCGTPLFMREDQDQVIEMAIGSLDHPAASAPTRLSGMESSLPWSEHLHTLPKATTASERTPADLAKLTSHQHPDHDTPLWPVPDGPKQRQP